VVARDLEMDAAGPRPLGVVDGEEALDLGHDLAEVARLAAATRKEDVAVHWVADPDDGVLRVAHRLDEPRQELADAVGAEARDQRQAPGNALRVQRLAEREQLVGRRRGPDLDANRIVDAGEEADVRAV